MMKPDAWIRHVMSESKLTNATKVVAFFVAESASEIGKPFQMRQKDVAHTGSRATVRRSIRDLKNTGYINHKRNGPFGGIYTLLMPSAPFANKRQRSRRKLALDQKAALIALREMGLV